MTLPTFFLIGAMKAGTTSLYAYLDQHPEIHMAPITHFFARPDDRGDRQGSGDRDSYERLFVSSLRVKGDSSPRYSQYPKQPNVPKRIAELIPEPRFLYLVRDPVDRIVSHYLHNVATRATRAPFDTAVGDLSDPNNPYIFPTLYAMQLEQYLEHFPLEAFLVIDQTHLASNRIGCLARIFEFLGVDGDFQCQAFHEKHGTAATRRQYPRGYEHFLARISGSPVRLMPPRVRRSSRRLVERTLWRPLPQPTVTVAARRKIERVCGPDVARLRAYTGQRFETWQL